MNKSKALSRQKAKCVTDLTTNQSVCLQTEKNHEKIGSVKNPTVKPHSYIVNVQEREYRRIRKHFLPVAEQNHLESQLCVTRCYFAQHLKRRLKQATLVLFKSLYHVKKWWKHLKSLRQQLNNRFSHQQPWQLDRVDLWSRHQDILCNLLYFSSRHDLTDQFCAL